MCVTSVWAINTSAYDQRFIVETAMRLGVAPQATDFRIASSRVRPSAVHFTFTRRMCDCDGLIGLQSRALVDGETPAASVIKWLRELPVFAPHTAQLALLRATSPLPVNLHPHRISEAIAVDVGEQRLRQIVDDELLLVNYTSDSHLRARSARG